MNRFSVLCAVLVLILAQFACGPYIPPTNNGSGGGNDGGGNNGGDSGPSSIGLVERILQFVWAGPENSLTEVTPYRDLYNGEAVKITDGGKAFLDFHNQIQVTLYNDSHMGGIYGEADPSLPNFVRMKLIRGGLLGKVVSEGNSTEISLAFGTTVQVLGTTFFVVYDEASGYVSVGNFDGDVYLYPHGGDGIYLGPSTAADIPPEGEVRYHELPNDPDLFDTLASERGSAMEALREIRRIYEQPLPGESDPTDTPPTPSFVSRTLLKSEGSYYSTDIAESYSIETTAPYIEFILRPELYLADGTPFTTSILRSILEEKWEYAAAGLVSFELVDDYTIWFFPIEASDITFILDEMSKFTFELLP
jgi:hypothetical protein